MEQLTAFIGWIKTPEAIVNMLTGHEIAEVKDDSGGDALEVTYPDGTTELYYAPVADAILDRAETFCSISAVLMQTAKANADQLAAQQGAAQ